MTAPIRTTLLDLVRAVNAFAESEAELLATVTSLVNTERVMLCGTFAGSLIPLP